MAENLGVQYGAWVLLYQSSAFDDVYPEENAHFNNVRIVDGIRSDIPSSIANLRETMFSQVPLDAAVFLGGMEGVIDEYKMIRRMQPEARRLVLSAGGGAAQLLCCEVPPEERSDSLDYVQTFYQFLQVFPAERRYQSPADQPALLQERLRSLKE